MLNLFRISNAILMLLRKQKNTVWFIFLLKYLSIKCTQKVFKVMLRTLNFSALEISFPGVIILKVQLAVEQHDAVHTTSKIGLLFETAEREIRRKSHHLRAHSLTHNWSSAYDENYQTHGRSCENQTDKVCCDIVLRLVELQPDTIPWPVVLLTVPWAHEGHLDGA